MVKRQAFKMGQQQPHTQDDLLELIPNDRLSAKQNELRRYVLAQHVPIYRMLRAFSGPFLTEYETLCSHNRVPLFSSRKTRLHSRASRSCTKVLTFRNANEFDDLQGPGFVLCTCARYPSASWTRRISRDWLPRD